SALAINELTANHVAWARWRNHANDDVVSWLDQVEVNVQAVAEQQCVACVQVWLDVVGEDFCLGGVWSQEHDDVSPSCSLSGGLDLEACFLCLLCGLGALAQTNDNLNARIAEVLGVCVALGAVANDGNLTALDQGEVSVSIIKQFNSHGRKSRLS